MINIIHRCGIPVVIMGETGCGKTRLIRFMCNLASLGSGRRNMLISKVLVCPALHILFCMMQCMFCCTDTPGTQVLRSNVVSNTDLPLACILVSFQHIHLLAFVAL